MYNTTATLKEGVEPLLCSKNSKVPRIKFSYRTTVPSNELPVVTNSRDAYDVLKSKWDKNRIGFVEQTKLILLNRANYVIGVLTLSTGGTSSTIVDPKLIFAASICCNASSIILAHNHPSGNPKPSEADITITKKINEGARILDLQLLDHIIATNNHYFSFADEGLLTN